MESDDEYEKERQENIQRNRDLMISLGINPDAGRSAPRPATKPKGPAKRSTRQPTRMSERPKRAPQRIVPAATAASKERTRRSARLRDDDTHTRENDGEEQQLSFPRLKRLPNPEPPIEDTINGTGELERAQLPQRDSSGNILFENNNRHFMPNLTPKEMLHGGIFGGTPFRPYYSRTLHRALDPQQEMAEFPADWFEGLDVETQLQSSLYRVEKNRFGVKAGQSLEDWEDAGWVAAQDPRGWWQWYFRFYLGRRTTDDARQIGRWLKACGPAGRFKRSLVSKVVQAGAEWDDETVTPVHICHRFQNVLSSTRKTKLKRKPESYTQPSNVSTLTQSDLLPSMHGTRPAGVTALDVSRDGALLATGGKDKHVQIYDKSTGKIAATLKGHTKEITHVAFAQSSIGLEHGNVAADAQAPTYVVSSAADDSVRVWQAAEKGGFTLLHTLSEFKGAVTGLGIHPSGEIFATSSKDGSIVIFDVSSGRQLLRTETPHEFTSLDVHPDGILVAAGTKDGAIYIYDIRSGQQSASFTSDASGSIVSSLSFSENGYLLASATGAQVEVWDLRKLNKTTSITLESLPSKSEGSVVRFDPSAQFLAIGGGGVRILANKSWEVLWTSGDGDAPTADVTDLKWTWSSGALILSSLDRTVRTFATKVE